MANDTVSAVRRSDSTQVGDVFLALAGPCRTTHRFRPGHLLYYERSPATGIFVIESGRAKVYKTGAAGKPYILRLAGPGEVLALEAIFNGGRLYSTAQMLARGVVHHIDSDRARELMHHDSRLAVLVAGQLASELSASNEERLELAQAAVRERMARLLTSLALSHGVPDELGVRIDLRLSREELAEMIGTAQETAIRQLSDFKDSRLIHLRGRSITVLDLDRLAKTANLVN
jgi:CRP-like cAMP-binding protein